MYNEITVCVQIPRMHLKFILFFLQVRAALLKSLSVYMSIRGHHDWVRRPSMFSAAYNNTAADTEAANYAEVLDRYNAKRNNSTTKQSLNNANEMVPLRWYTLITILKKIPIRKYFLFFSHLSFFRAHRMNGKTGTMNNNINNGQTAAAAEPILMTHCKRTGERNNSIAMKTSWILCFRGLPDSRHDHVVPESVVFDLSE